MNYQFPWTEFMQEMFEEFECDMGVTRGTSVISAPVPIEVIERYKGVLPDNLLAYWERYGWCGYDNGLFWTVNPDEYSDIIHTLTDISQLDDPNENFVIARGAFGKLAIWNNRRGYMMSYNPNIGLLTQSHIDQYPELGKDELEKDMAIFFGNTSGYRYDQYDENDHPLFERALAQYGPLAANEMYAFVPATCLGGKWYLENLEKVDITTHIAMLMELQPPQLQLVV